MFGGGVVPISHRWYSRKLVSTNYKIWKCLCSFKLCTLNYFTPSPPLFVFHTHINFLHQCSDSKFLYGLTFPASIPVIFFPESSGHISSITNVVPHYTFIQDPLCGLCSVAAVQYYNLVRVFDYDSVTIYVYFSGGVQSVIPPPSVLTAPQTRAVSA